VQVGDWQDDVCMIFDTADTVELGQLVGALLA
jgi:hypothetical protein